MGGWDRKEKTTDAKGLSLDLNLKERKPERLKHYKQEKKVYNDGIRVGSRDQIMYRISGHGKDLGVYMSYI